MITMSPKCKCTCACRHEMRAFVQANKEGYFGETENCLQLPTKDVAKVLFLKYKECQCCCRHQLSKPVDFDPENN